MGGFRIGRLLGIPIEVRYSFLLLLLFAFLVYGGLVGVALLLVTFGSVLLHELGHAIVARRLGVEIVSIELHFFGGAARMASMPSRPRDEIMIAAAGPAVSFALALLGGGLFALTGARPALHLAVINLILGLFNLLPALPMDGGRILRAALTKRMGRLRATATAVKVARVVAVGLGVFGLVSAQLFLVALAVMLWLMASAELRSTQLWHHHFHQGASRYDHYDQADGVEVLDRNGRVVNRSQSQARGHGAFRIEEQRSGGRRRWVLVGPDGTVLLASDRPLHY